jgi:hypothetical protein
VHRARIVARRDAVHLDRALARQEIAGEQADHRGLARAVRAEQPERLAGLDAQVERGERDAIAEAPREPARLDETTARRLARPAHSASSIAK